MFTQPTYIAVLVCPLAYLFPINKYNDLISATRRDQLSSMSLNSSYPRRHHQRLGVQRLLCLRVRLSRVLSSTWTARTHRTGHNHVELIKQRQNEQKLYAHHLKVVVHQFLHPQMRNFKDINLFRHWHTRRHVYFMGWPTSAHDTYVDGLPNSIYHNSKVTILQQSYLP